MHDITFESLRHVSLPDEEIMETYEDLRFAFENTYPNVVDASDAYILTAFPFAKNDEILDDYEVESYETGFFQGMPALRKGSDENQILYLKDRDSFLLESTYIQFY